MQNDECMIIKLQCDKCGKQGSADEIVTRYDGADLCPTCTLQSRLNILRSDLASKVEWLESTHMKEVKELETEIAYVELKLSQIA